MVTPTDPRKISPLKVSRYEVLFMLYFIIISIVNLINQVVIYQYIDTIYNCGNVPII